MDSPFSGMTTMSGPPLCFWTTGVGSFCPHQFEKVSDVESNVDVPQPSVVVGSVPVGSTPVPLGSKLVGV
jgi:hypothetical protein